MVWNQALSNFRVCLCTPFDLPSSSYFLLLLFFVINLFFCWCAKWDALVLYFGDIWQIPPDAPFCSVKMHLDPFLYPPTFCLYSAISFCCIVRVVHNYTSLHLALKPQPASVPPVIPLVTTVVETERHSSGKTKSVFPEVMKCTWGVLHSTWGRGEGLCSLVSAGIRKRGGALIEWKRLRGTTARCAVQTLFGSWLK